MVISQGEGFPSDEIQLVLGCLALFVGSFIDAFLFGFIISNIHGINLKQSLLNSKLDSVRTTMKDMKFETTFQRKMFHAVRGPIFTAIWKQDLDKFLGVLSPSLHRHVITDVCCQAMKSCPILHRIYSYCTEHSFQLIMKSPDDIIFNYGDEPDGIYFVVSGGVGLFAPSLSRNSFKYVRSLTVGSYFGEIGVTLNISRTLTVNSRGHYSTLAFMRKDVIQECLRQQALLVEVFFRKIDRYNDENCNLIYKRLKRSKVFPYSILQILRFELFKFKIVTFQTGEYLWKVKDRVKGMMVILSGYATFAIKAQNFIIPVDIASPGDIVGYDHCIVDYIENMTYLRAESVVKVALFQLKQFNQLRFRNPKFAQFARKEEDQIILSTLRPYPIDIVKTRQRKERNQNWYKLKNGVIWIIKKLKGLDDQKLVKKVKQQLSIENRRHLDERGKRLIDAAQTTNRGLRHLQESLLERHIDESLEFMNSDAVQFGAVTTSMSGIYIHPTEPIERFTLTSISSDSFISQDYEHLRDSYNPTRKHDMALSFHSMSEEDQEDQVRLDSISPTL